MKKYSCCIFDLDGTIINTIHALTYTVNLLLERYHLHPVTEEQMKLFVGDGYKKQMERSLLAAGDEELAFYEQSLVDYQELFQTTCLHELEPYEGMRELLDRMKAAGMKLAVFTNKPHERGIENVEAIYGKGYFDLILGQKEGFPKKPDPAGVFAILKELDIRPEDCLYMGDTNTDMLTAKAAGLDAVGAVWGFRGREELEEYNPEYMAEHPLDVAEMLEI